jgi:hypothetical protein
MVHDNGDGFHNYPEADRAAYKKNMEWRLAGHPLHALHGSMIEQDQVDYLRKIVDLCRARGIECVLYFAPMHAWVFEMERYTASFHLSTDLRRRVAEFSEFWDFSLINEVNGEPIDDMKYFIDTIHYRPRTGAMVLATLHGKRPEGISETFGVRVDRSNIDEHIRRFHRSLDQWRTDNPQEAVRVREHFETLFRKTVPPAVSASVPPNQHPTDGLHLETVGRQ